MGLDVVELHIFGVVRKIFCSVLKILGWKYKSTENGIRRKRIEGNSKVEKLIKRSSEQKPTGNWNRVRTKLNRERWDKMDKRDGDKFSQYFESREKEKSCLLNADDP